MVPDQYQGFAERYDLAAGRWDELEPAVLEFFRQLFGSRFDAVVCLGAIGDMTDEEEFHRAFGSMRAVLRDGGILVLTTIPTDRQWQEKPRFALAANTEHVSRLFVMDYLGSTPESRGRGHIA